MPKSVIFTAVPPVTLSLLPSARAMVTAIVFVLVTPAMVREPVASNCPAAPALGFSPIILYSILGNFSCFIASSITVSMLFLPLLSWRTGMLTSTRGVTALGVALPSGKVASSSMKPPMTPHSTVQSCRVEVPSIFILLPPGSAS